MEFEAPPRRHYVVPFSTIALVVAVLLYGSAHLISRTEGFRTLVSDKLSEGLGMPVRVERCGAAWNLDLLLTGLKAQPAEGKGRAVFELERGRVGWSLERLRGGGGGWLQGVELEKARLALQEEADGEWTPRPLAPFAEWVAQWAGIKDATTGERSRGGRGKRGRADSPQRGEGGPEAAGERAQPSAWDDVRWCKNLEIAVRDGRIEWWSADGTLLAQADDLDLVVTPLVTPARRMKHYQARVGSVETTRGRHVRDLRFEVLTTRGHQIVLGFDGDWVARGEGVGSPWAGALPARKRERLSERPRSEAACPRVAELPAVPERTGVTTEVADEGSEDAGQRLPQPLVIEGDQEDLAAHIRRLLEEAAEE